MSESRSGLTPPPEKQEIQCGLMRFWYSKILRALRAQSRIITCLGAGFKKGLLFFFFLLLLFFFPSSFLSLFLSFFFPSFFLPLLPFYPSFFRIFANVWSNANVWSCKCLIWWNCLHLLSIQFFKSTYHNFNESLVEIRISLVNNWTVFHLMIG